MVVFLGQTVLLLLVVWLFIGKGVADPRLPIVCLAVVVFGMSLVFLVINRDGLPVRGFLKRQLVILCFINHISLAVWVYSSTFYTA